MKSKKLILCIFVTIAIISILPTITACEGFDLSSPDLSSKENSIEESPISERAEITIEGRSLQQGILSYGCSRCGYAQPYHEEPKPSVCPRCGVTLTEATNDVPRIEFPIKIKALNIEANTQYYLVLLSRSGYLYDLYPVLWSSDDLTITAVDPNERDMNKIREYEREEEEKLIRRINLRAEANDKEIEPLWRDFNNFYKECWDKALEHEELSLTLGGYDLGSFEPDESDFNRICNKYIEIKLLTYDECKEIEGAGEYLGF